MLYLSRLLVLALLFIAAGCINLVIGLLRPFHPSNSRLFGRVYALPALRILGFRRHIDDHTLRTLGQPCVVVANHQSNFDLFTLGSVVPPRLVTIGKKSLRWIPLFGQVFWLAGNVLIDRGNAAAAKQSMLATTDTLRRKGISIWVFAEGTRNHGKGLLPFKKGAFQMAIAAGVPIVLLCCNDYVRHMQLNRWRGGELRVRTLEPIPTAGLTLDDVPALMAQCHARMQACIGALNALTPA